jgi:hypothetical protein
MIYILNQNNEVKGVLTPQTESTPFYNDTYTERLDGSSELEFSISINKEIGAYHFTDEIQIFRNIIYRDLDKNLILMKILEIDEESKDNKMFKKVYCENLAISELSKVIKSPKNWEADPLDSTGFRGDYAEITGFSANDELYEILYNTGWNYAGSDMNLTQIDLNPFLRNNYQNAYEQLIELCSIIGAELKFSVELDGTRILRKTVYLANSLGRNLGTVFYYGSDILQCRRIIDSKNLISSLIPVGGSNESRIQLDITDVDTADQRIVDALTASGDDFVISGNMIYSKFALQSFGNGNHIVGLYENSDIGADIKTEAGIANEKIGLTLEGINYLEQNCLPAVSYEIKLNYLAEYTGERSFKSLRLGDEIIIIDRTFSPELRVRARVQEITTSLSDISQNSVVLGNIRPIIQSGTKQLKELNNKLKTLTNTSPKTYIKEFIQLTQADYEALTEIDDNTIYFTTEV